MTGLVADGLVARSAGGFRAGPLTLELAAGDAAALVGRAGSGKSLLLSALAGLAPVAEGTVTIGGARWPGGDLAALRRRLGFTFQRDALLPELTAAENVALAARARGLDDVSARARQALADVGLADAGERAVFALSGGMRRRLGLARALACEPAVLLCDDVTAGLDPSTAATVMERVLARVRAGRACALVTTHDVDTVLPRVERALVLDEGRVIFQGAPGELHEREALLPFAPRRAA